MSSSSGFLSSSVTHAGSSAIPQIGQDPGSSRTISGCIGQVHSVFVTGAAMTGSSAIPHFGQAPGPLWRTSGSIGQVYSASPVPLRAAAGAAPADSRKLPGSAWNRSQAALVAEVVRLAVVLDVTDRVGRIDRHAADGIEHCFPLKALRACGAHPASI